MQLILVRHAQPIRVEQAGGPADPELAAIGVEQAGRVPDALRHHRISRVVSSPQRRAKETATPTAAKLGLDVEVIDDLAEYDRDLPVYVPIEDAKTEFRDTYERIKAGYLPVQIDGEAFRRRVIDAITEIAADTDAADTVVIFAHGGVINVMLQDVLGLARPLTFPIDYCSVTRILLSRTGRRSAATVNENGHVWDLLPRNITAGP
ncbi:histidine phosphatase family protein [Nocardia donostiensis]|uniref:Histidine phosphatase family protein n=1 Tax=Nocardia donostiensis TaxID=1538463 RepID=A0A1W0BAZ9_9NOCA|nr:histidine phosphatase family protein [Nocardia donostiensis]ONM49113.1 histidine phosphatase family protein [Nocardia donostiensis]OQS14131.1 histidine phosphatase family protein [Nocardia donostiensis]OQS19709.1 histidine phosphatase family protein [Nocardia donostiensis]